jgi:polysaccharide biosynthesis/export protein
MFKVPENTELKQQAEEAQRNYIIQANDYLKIGVYTKNGERLIDPDLELLREIPVQTGNLKPDPNYLVDINGVAKFPMIGEIKVQGLTIRQAEELIQKEYTDKKFYKDVFVTLQYTNKRVVLLGSPGGAVIEILALGKGVDNLGKAHNIRVLRGQEFFLVDFSTIDGYRKGNMIMQHGDIVYVEPVRRPVSEAVRDYGPLLSLAVSLSTLVIVLVGL